ncbi:SGS domain-domain-containing protein [Kockovaella imperatae]|uniref:SGS domain-domain-containing protein n=1 Tax=Kockovaella imperatae TaxID=4999 RepID=A0A1Y1UHB1_9TREE|nr:SGS domain-domain-containing protein [Kockovaella imperatae]ORX37450.1 SGS domain-domain-containing protein [Kockovaella imperatae]
MEPVEVPVPRYDFYQTPLQLILSLYVKGYGAADVSDKVDVVFREREIIIDLPALGGANTDQQQQRITLKPLSASILPDQSTSRVLSSKIELKLAKVVPENWISLLYSPDSTPLNPLSANQVQTPGLNGEATGSSAETRPVKPDVMPATTSAPVPNVKARKNWDKVVEEDDEGAKDPNEGGDAALKEFFAKIYGDADDDTKRAMIKSYTESGGTALSTNWNQIGKETTPIRPPEGMEARRYN